MTPTQRLQIIKKLIRSGMYADEVLRGLQQGFIPEHIIISPEYQELILEELKEHPKEETCDLLKYSNYFNAHPEKILGYEKAGTGFINPVLTVGSKEGVIQFFENYLQEPLTSKKTNDKTATKSSTMAKSTTKSKKQTGSDPGSDTETSVAVQVQPKNTRHEGEIITIEESIKLFNSHLRKEDIQAWVWYKRQHGNPMTGWEEYYIDSAGGNLSDVLIFSKVDTMIKSPAFADLRTISAGTMIGKKTKYKNEYRGVEWIIVRNENGDLFYVNGTEIREQVNKIKTDSSKLDTLVMSKALCFYSGEYLPVPVFINGDIYETLSEIEKDSENIISAYGDEIYEWQKSLLKPSEANKLRVDDPIKAKRFRIGCFSSFSNDVEEFSVKELDEETGIKLERPRKRGEYGTIDHKWTLFEAFNIWLDGVKDSEIKNTTKHEIRNYYFAKRPIFADKDMPEAEKEELKNYARIEAENLYGEFLATSLTYEDRIRINEILNRKHNNFNAVDGKLIPVGLECSAKFGNRIINFYPHQRDAIGFLSLRNSGFLAYQVGFGKTFSAIVNVSSLLSQGKIKRPVIAVPKPVYSNWKKELFGYYKKGDTMSFKPFDGSTFYPGILSGTRFKINDWYNLSDDFIKSHGGIEAFKSVDVNSITLVTYQGLARMGFSDKIFDKQYDKLTAALGNIQADNERQFVKEVTKRQADVMTALQDTVINYDELDFDYLVVDEAHNFKNLFPRVGKDPDTGRALYGISSGESMRAKRLFFLTIYLQERYNGNVCLLSATPFTNSPLEIFSMMNYVGYNQLVKSGLQQITSFFDLFVLETIEYKVDKKGDIKTDRVIKSFNNKIILNKLLYSVFDYKDDPKEVGIVRPCKVNFPNNKINTYLDISPLQIEIQAQAKSMMNSSSYGDGNLFRALAMSLNNALSPFLAMKQAPEDYYELLESSPKIKYAVFGIKGIKEYHDTRQEDVSGSIIYMSRGVELIPYIKEALEQICGFKKRQKFGEDLIDEVEVMEGGGGEAAEDKKEIIKEAFNAGIVKVIIGTSVIKEGVNLQVRGANLFILVPDWNPTDINQVEGRIHRQGNTYGYVRVVQPLVQNTIDAFVYQKYDEKKTRINNLWDRSSESNISENSQLETEEIKFALVNDPDELLKLKVGSEIKRASREVQIAKENLEVYSKLEEYIKNYKEQKTTLISDLESIVTDANEKYLPKLYVLESDLKKPFKERIYKSDPKQIETYIEKTKAMLDLIAQYMSNENDIKLMFEVFRKIGATNWNLTPEYIDVNDSDYDFNYDLKNADSVIFSYNRYTYDRFKGTWSQLAKAERSVLTPYGLSIYDDLSIIKKKLQKKLAVDEQYLLYVESAEFSQKMLAEVQIELDKRQALRGDIMEQIQRFSDTNYLLSYKSENTDLETCEIPIGPCCDTHNYEKRKNYEQEMEIEELTGTTEGPKKSKDEQEHPISFSKEALEFVPVAQVKAAKSWELNNVKREINERVKNLPSYNGNKDQTVWLHYFKGGSDYFVLEKDFADSYRNVFGWAILNNDEMNAELGSTALSDLKNNMELDFYWTPKPLQQAKNELLGKSSEETKQDSDTENAEVLNDIELLEMLLQTAKGKEKKELENDIELLKLLL